MKHRFTRPYKTQLSFPNSVWERGWVFIGRQSDIKPKIEQRQRMIHHNAHARSQIQTTSVWVFHGNSKAGLGMSLKQPFGQTGGFLAK